MFPNQKQPYNTSSSLNILQGQSLRVAAAPHQQPVQTRMQSPSHLPIQAPLGTGQGSSFNQQAPQVGVRSWNLQYLSTPGYAAHDTVINNLPMHIPAYSGNGVPQSPTVIPLAQPNFPTFQKLPYR